FVPRLERREARSRLGLAGEGPLLFTVRRLVPRMGLEPLLHALARLPDARLVIGGSGWLRPRLEASASALGVASRVRFAGRIDDADLPVFYQAADLVVLPSVALEGFGLITLEALACGTPVVATAKSGATDVVAPLAPSWIAPDASPAVPTAWRTALGLVPLSAPPAPPYRIVPSRLFRNGRIGAHVYRDGMRALRRARPDIVQAEVEPWSLAALQCALAAPAARLVIFTW